MREDAIYKRTRGFYGRSHVLLHRTVADKTQFRKHGIFADEQKGRKKRGTQTRTMDKKEQLRIRFAI